MKKGLLLLSITLASLNNKVFCQPGKLFDHLSNDSIKFRVFRTSLEIIGKNQLSTPREFIIVELTKADSGFLLRMRCSDWYRALDDPKTDWAANLLLYAIYERDAVLFFSILRKREDWIQKTRRSDIEYWKKILQ